MKISEWWQRKCRKHKWIVLYRGRMETLRQCQYCGEQKWIQN